MGFNVTIGSGLFTPLEGEGIVGASGGGASAGGALEQYGRVQQAFAKFDGTGGWNFGLAGFTSLGFGNYAAPVLWKLAGGKMWGRCSSNTTSAVAMMQGSSLDRTFLCESGSRVQWTVRTPAASDGVLNNLICAFGISHNGNSLTPPVAQGASTAGFWFELNGSQWSITKVESTPLRTITPAIAATADTEYVCVFEGTALRTVTATIMNAAGIALYSGSFTLTAAIDPGRHDAMLLNGGLRSATTADASLWLYGVRVYTDRRV